MNRLFASLPLPTRDGETKGKMMATKKAGQTKDCHKDKADHSAVCIWKRDKKGGKTCKRVAKNGSSTSKLIRKVFELGPGSSGPFGFI